MKEILNRYLICGATGDRADLADYFVLQIDKELLQGVEILMEAAERVNHMTPGVLDITERGTIEFYVVYDFPNGDRSPLFQQIEEWDFLSEPMLLPEGVYEAARLGDYGSIRKTECHGVQVWPDSGHVRLTCYPKEASYRIESSTCIASILQELRKNFRWEQPVEQG